MRQYPRSLVKGTSDRIRVNNEMEEYQAGLEGYESHRDPAINLKQKGTAKEVLRVKPVNKFSEADELIKKQAIETARAEIKAEARAEAQKIIDEDNERVLQEKAEKEKLAKDTVKVQKSNRRK